MKTWFWWLNAAAVGLCWFLLAVAFPFGMQAGWDAQATFLKPYQLTSTAPAWVYLVTQPVGAVPWPYSLVVWNTLSVLGVLGACRIFRVRWWLGLMNLAMIWNISLGNIEIFTAAGAVIAYLVVTRSLPKWLGSPGAVWGVGLILLATKPQVGLGLMIYGTWRVWKDRGWRGLAHAALASLAVLALTYTLWGNWIPGWLQTVLVSRNPISGTWNASIFPYGLVFLPFAWIPTPTPLRKLRLILAVTLLASPYFSLYHAGTLLTMTDWGVPFVLTWLTSLNSYGWADFTWLVPGAVAAGELLAWARTRKEWAVFWRRLPEDG